MINRNRFEVIVLKKKTLNNYVMWNYKYIMWLYFYNLEHDNWYKIWKIDIKIDIKVTNILRIKMNNK